MIDYANNGRPIGIEITAPSRVSVAAINTVLEALGCPAVSQEDLAPLLAA